MAAVLPDHPLHQHTELETISVVYTDTTGKSLKSLHKVLKSQNSNRRKTLVVVNGIPSRFLPLLKELDFQALVTFRDFDSEKFRNTLDQWLQGEVYIDKPFLSEIIKTKYDKIAERLKSLSEREIEVIEKTLQDQSNEDIAKALQLSIRTVNAHKRNILKKLKARHMEGAIYQYIFYGLPYFGYHR